MGSSRCHDGSAESTEERLSTPSHASIFVYLLETRVRWLTDCLVDRFFSGEKCLEVEVEVGAEAEAEALEEAVITHARATTITVITITIITTIAVMTGREQRRPR